jgi:hypothetical protein
MTLSRRKTLALIGGGTIVAATAASATTITRPLDARLRPGPRRGGTPIRACARSAGRSSRRIRTTCSRGWWTCRSRTPRSSTPTPTGCCRTPTRSRARSSSAGMFPRGHAHGRAQDGLAVEDGPVPRRRKPAGARRTPRRDLPLSAHRRGARSALRSCRTAAATEGALRHVAPGPGRGAGPIASVAVMAPVGVTDAEPTGRGDARPQTVRAMEIEIDTPHTFAGKRRPLPHRAPRGRRQSRRASSSTGPPSRRCALFGLFTREAAWTRQHARSEQGRRRLRSPSTPRWPTSGLVTSDNTRATRSPRGVTGSRSTSPHGGRGRVPPAEPGVAGIPRDGGGLRRDARPLRAGGGTVQMLCRLGYGPEIGPTPRWPARGQDVWMRDASTCHSISGSSTRSGSSNSSAAPGSRRGCRRG